MSNFHPYNPRTLSRRSQPKACEACYIAKVKCNISTGDEACKNCRQHGTECCPRARKRKETGAASTDIGQTTMSSQDPGLEQSKTNTGRKRQRFEFYAHHDPEAETIGSTAAAPPLQNDTDQNLTAPPLFVAYDTTFASSPSTTADAAISSVDSFYNSSYLSRSAILGNDFPDIDHSHVEQSVKRREISSTEIKVLELYSAFDLPELPLQQSLIEAFQEKCWTWMPVVDLPADAQGFISNGLSLLPLQAVMLVGALMRPGVCTKATCDTYYYRVRSLVHSGYERNPLNLLAALCLVQYYTPTAPKDVSVDTPRFWWSAALGIAQQVGLHRQPSQRDRDHSLRRRLWWTLYARDSIMSSAHGRPRLLRLTNSTMKPPSIHDFPDPNSVRAHIFITYVGITEIMCDLCELLVSSNHLAAETRGRIEQRLVEFVQKLPASLRLHDSKGIQRPYDFELAQLHIPLLTTIIILYRPCSVFSLSSPNAIGVVAAFLNFRIFQAIELREQTRSLSSTFSWYLLVTAIPHLSSLRIPALCKEASSVLDAIEGILRTLGTVRPSATTNLQNVKAIRKALSTTGASSSRSSRPSDMDTQKHDPPPPHLVRELLGIYGPRALSNFDAIASAIDQASHDPDPSPQRSNIADLDGMTEEHMRSRTHVMQYQNDAPDLTTYDAVDDGLDSLFGTHFQESMWMRDWIDELQHFPE